MNREKDGVRHPINSDIRESRAAISGDETFSAEVSSATPGSYEVSVAQLAQVQKSVSQEAYASKTDVVFGTGEQSLALDAPAQQAQQAVAYIDGVEVTSQTNTIEEALNGVTLNLESVSADDGSGGPESTTLNIDTNTDAVVEKMGAFVQAYNDAVSFVTSQSKVGDSQGGMLLGDSGLNNVKRRLQGLLTTQVQGNDSYSTLSQLRLSTKRDGTLNFDAGVMNEAISGDFEEVTRLIAGGDNTDGIFKQYKQYLGSMTDSRTGLYAGRQDNIDRKIDRIDDDIVKMEDRLERREQMYLDKFTALEQMVAEMNSQSKYLTKQMDKLPSYGGGD